MKVDQKKCGKTTAKENPRTPAVTSCGKRTIINQNFSKLVSLPKIALENLGNNITEVNVELVHDSDSKYIKLVPITRGGESK